MSEPPIPTWKHLLNTFMKHKVERKSYFSPSGLLRKFEALPVVLITSTVFFTASLYFTLYYWWARTDVQFKLWKPLEDRIDLNKPKQCKFIKSCEYENYKPVTELQELLLDMHCAELARKKAIEDWINQQKGVEAPVDPCEKRQRPVSSDQ